MAKKLASFPTCWFIVLLLGLPSFTLLPAPASAAASPVPALIQPARPAPLFAGLMDGIVGNRSRMIQVAFIGFSIGVVILMTATRKR